MNLHAEIDINDFKAFRSYIYSRGRKKSFLMNMLVGMIIGFAAIILIRAKNIPFHLPSFIGAGVVFIAILLFYVSMARKKYLPSNNGITLGRKRYILSDGKFIEEGENYRNELLLDSIISLVETKNHFFVMVDKYAAYIIPKRSFGKPESVESFKHYFEDTNIKMELA